MYLHLISPSSSPMRSLFHVCFSTLARRKSLKIAMILGPCKSTCLQENQCKRISGEKWRPRILMNSWRLCFEGVEFGSHIFLVCLWQSAHGKFVVWVSGLDSLIKGLLLKGTSRIPDHQPKPLIHKSRLLKNVWLFFGVRDPVFYRTWMNL